jgi:hypothetical protein
MRRLHRTKPRDALPCLSCDRCPNLLCRFVVYGFLLEERRHARSAEPPKWIPFLPRTILIPDYPVPHQVVHPTSRVFSTAHEPQAFAARYTSFDGFPAYRCLFLDVRRVVHRRRPLPPRRQHRPLRRLRPRLRRTTHVARAKCAAVGLEMWYVDAVSFAAFVRRNESSRRASGSSPGEPLHLKHSGPRPARSGANNLRKPNASRFTSSCRAIRPS